MYIDNFYFVPYNSTIPMSRSFWKLFVRALIIVVIAIFIGLPLGFAFLNIVSNPSRLSLNIFSLAVFIAAAGFLGNRVANKLIIHDAKSDAETNPHVLEQREKYASKVLSASLVILPLLLLIQILFMSAVSASTILIEAITTLISFVAWRRYDPKKSVAMKILMRNLFLYLVAAFVASLIRLRG